MSCPERDTSSAPVLLRHNARINTRAPCWPPCGVLCAGRCPGTTMLGGRGLVHFRAPLVKLVQSLTSPPPAVVSTLYLRVLSCSNAATLLLLHRSATATQSASPLLCVGTTAKGSASVHDLVVMSLVLCCHCVFSNLSLHPDTASQSPWEASPLACVWGIAAASKGSASATI